MSGQAGYDVRPRWSRWRWGSVAELQDATNPDWIEAYQIGEDSSSEEHLRDPLDTVRFRAAHLSSCLQISEEGDSAVVLLNPEVVTQEGE